MAPFFNLPTQLTLCQRFGIAGILVYDYAEYGKCVYNL